MIAQLFGRALGTQQFRYLGALAQVGSCSALCGGVRKIPDIARAVADGVYHGSAGMNAVTFGMAREVTQAAAAGGAARGAASGAIRAASGPGNGEGGVPWRGKGPVGRSLSRGDR